jgi:hypothetical protein
MSYQLTDEDMELVRAALARIADKEAADESRQRLSLLEEAAAVLPDVEWAQPGVEWTDEARRVIDVVVRRLHRAHFTTAANWLASEVNQ